MEILHLLCLCEQDTTGSSMSVSHYGHVPVEGEDHPISSV